MSPTIAPAPARVPTAQRPGLRGLAARRPLTLFFVLANLMSWVAWVPYILSDHGLGVWDFSYPGGSDGGQLLGLLPGAYLGPIASALLVTVLAEGRDGLRAWLRRLWHWRVSWRWYAGVLLAVPAGVTLTAVLLGADAHPPTVAALVTVVPGLIGQMITTGLAEEPGWRDFALPRLQRKLGPLGAAAVLGPLWAVWHLPLFLTEWGGWPDASWSRPVVFIGFCIAFNIVMTWVFNRTGQSLPMAMILHASLNNFASVLGADMFPGLDAEEFQIVLLVGATAVAAVILAATRGRLGYRP